MSKKNENLEIQLSGDEALVLFDFLARFCESQTLKIIDQAEERALWNLHALLEKQLVEPFKSDYTQLLNLARNRLSDKSK